LDRQREVAARGHPIPDPVKILTEILIELGNADPVNSRRATISFNALVRVPNFTLDNIKRLCLRHKRHPLAGCAYTETERRRPFGPAPLQGLLPYYERLRPCAPHRYSRSCEGYPLELLP